MRQLELSGLEALRSFELREEKVYFCFHLLTDSISLACLKELEALGVECLMEGRAKEAFGIAPDTEEFIENVQDIEDIMFVERREPPVGM